MFLHHHEQQQRENCWVENYQDRNMSGNINPNNHHHNMRNEATMLNAIVYQDGYSGPQPGPDYIHPMPNFVNNHTNLLNNFVNQYEIVNNDNMLINNNNPNREVENIHKRKFDSLTEEKDDSDIIEDEDQSPTITEDTEYSRDSKRVKTSLSSILANLQVSDETDSKPQNNSSCTQLMCYESVPNLSLPIDQAQVDLNVDSILRKKVLTSFMNQSTREYIPDPTIDLKLQPSSSEEDKDDKNQRAVVLYRDFIGRDELLKRLVQLDNGDSQSNQMEDE